MDVNSRTARSVKSLLASTRPSSPLDLPYRPHPVSVDSRPGYVSVGIDVASSAPFVRKQSNAEDFTSHSNYAVQSVGEHLSILVEMSIY